MKITKSSVVKIKIEEIEGLDSINVFLEDLGPRRGKITIDCYGKAWSAYWGGMGDRTISQFFCSCDEHYLAKNLSNINSEIDDYENLTIETKKEIIKKRKAHEVDIETAREWFDDAETIDHDNIDQGLLQDVFGDEWWYCIPTKSNPDYEYLCRIIKTVKEAIKKK